ncbi:Glycerate dehydrogenase [Alloiococcus otitis]|uniref:Hydroxyacid dehydrogenase n=1 Tax=Alloiococcus otitis ATCC 51267 TaxID=883081 RepID=K9EAT3_9LACT|nr:2-hydroxyacid dehydrogenase [Alloiococcus otitis]EKU92931.1 hypothetical protein HMPREF9698_01534 [Alloiococcus otitis ATCC 51267]SUU80442.1 Glycerate dehydrogenase [Alloiococcus otitis]
MKVSLLEPLNVSQNLIDRLAQPIKDLGHDFVYYSDQTSDPEELADRTGDSDIVMIANTPYPKQAFSQADKLQLINVAFTGIDHVDQEAAREKGIKIANAAGYSDQSVAEHVIGLILDLYRQISWGNQAIRQSNFPGPSQGRVLAGKTVGIIGTGNIGLKTASLLKAFGVQFLAYSRTEKDQAKAMGVKYVSLERLLEESDIVTVHLPHNDQTQGLLSKDKLALMKDTAILINCARGPIVDNDGLADLLNQGQLAGAGIDVFDREPPLPEDYKLLQAQNTILTPHVAYLTDQAMVNRAKIVFDTTLAYLKGEEKNIQLG